MQTVEVRLWDDLHHRQDGEKVAADVQVELEYRCEKRTRRVRLDLTAQHGDELAKLLAPYLEAGTPSDDQGQSEVKPGGKIRRKPPGDMPNRVWRRQMRAWADELGLVNREDSRYPAWQTVTGKHYYPSDLEDAFLLHQAGREEEALAMVEKFRPRAAA